MSKRHKKLEIPSHKHCLVCDKPIPFDEDKKVCSKECEERYGKARSTQSRWEKVRALVPLAIMAVCVIWLLLPRA